MSRSKLNPLHKRFADEWLKDNNGVRAYKCVYKNVKKDATASAAATRLLKNVNVDAYIKLKQAETAAALQITQQRILEEEARLAFSDLRMLFNGETTIAPGDLPEDIARAVSGIEIKENQIGDQGVERTYKYKLWDKGRSLERISKHLGMYEKDNNQKRFGIDEIFQSISSLDPELAKALRDRLISHVKSSNT